MPEETNIIRFEDIPRSSSDSGDIPRYGDNVVKRIDESRRYRSPYMCAQLVGSKILEVLAMTPESFERFKEALRSAQKYIPQVENSFHIRELHSKVAAAVTIAVRIAHPRKEEVIRLLDEMRKEIDAYIKKSGHSRP